jgi:hypothetical protein
MNVDGTDWWARLWESNLLRNGTKSDDAPDAMAALTQARQAATRTSDSADAWAVLLGRRGTALRHATLPWASIQECLLTGGGRWRAS